MIEFQDYNKNFRIRYIPKDSSIFLECLNNGVWCGEGIACHPLNIRDSSFNQEQLRESVKSSLKKLHTKHSETEFNLGDKVYFEDIISYFNNGFNFSGALEELNKYFQDKDNERNLILVNKE